MLGHGSVKECPEAKHGQVKQHNVVGPNAPWPTAWDVRENLPATTAAVGTVAKVGIPPSQDHTKLRNPLMYVYIHKYIHMLEDTNKDLGHKERNKGYRNESWVFRWCLIGCSGKGLKNHQTASAKTQRCWDRMKYTNTSKLQNVTRQKGGGRDIMAKARVEWQCFKTLQHLPQPRSRIETRETPNE